MKKIKKYMSGGMMAIILLSAISPQMTVNATVDNRSDMIVSENDILANDPDDMDFIDGTAIYSDQDKDTEKSFDTEDITSLFTDPNFLSAVRENLGLSGNDPITRADCASVIKLDVQGRDIKRLDGIRCFTALQILRCDDNHITDLDLSGCSNLQYLYCGENQMERLDVEGCSGLKGLYCGSSMTGDGYYLGGGKRNQIDSLDVQTCTDLETLACEGNRLLTLDVSRCEKLSVLYCEGNQLENINIGNGGQLTNISCGGNKLKTLDISGCTKLESIFCQFNQLTSLDVQNCTELKILYFNANKINAINVENCKNLTQLSCIENSLSELDINNCRDLTWLYCSKNNLTDLDLSQCPVLERLYCGGNRLQDLDLSYCTQLIFLDIREMGLDRIDLGICTKLESLDCKNNELAELDLDALPNLKYLYCDGNKLTDLDISSCPGLIVLYCHDNKLTNLDVSSCPGLKNLFCQKNHMKTPDDVKGRTKEFDGEVFVFYPQNDSTDDLTPPSETKEKQNLTIKPDPLALYVGGKAKALNVSGAKGKVKYKNSNPKVVNINSKGIVTPLVKGKATITVTAAGNDTYESASVKIKVTVYGKPAKVKNVKAVSAKKKGTLKVSWKKVDSASGYTIRYSYNKNMKNPKTVNVPKGKTTSKIINKFTSKKYVYIQIQAYQKKDGLTIPGSWSSRIKSKSKVS